MSVHNRHSARPNHNLPLISTSPSSTHSSPPRPSVLRSYRYKQWTSLLGLVCGQPGLWPILPAGNPDTVAPIHSRSHLLPSLLQPLPPCSVPSRSVQCSFCSVLSHHAACLAPPCAGAVLYATMFVTYNDAQQDSACRDIARRD